VTTAQKLKVAMVCFEWPNSTGHTGGVGRYVHRLAQSLKDHVDLTVFTFDGGEVIEGVEFVFIRRPMSRFGRFYLSPVMLTFKLSVREFDIVHAHGDDWAVARRKSIVRSFYGSSRSEARSSRGLRRWNHYILWLLEAYSSKRSAITVAIAPESKKEFGTDFLIPPLAALPTDVEPAPRDIPTFVFVGSFEGRKRGWLAADAVDRLRKQLNIEIDLVVIGPKEDAGKWPDFVRHCSGLDDDSVLSLLIGAWALLAPSSYEGFGIPTVEALNVPIRVIASRNPGNDYFAAMAEVDLPLHRAETEDQFVDLVSDSVERGRHLKTAEVEAAGNFIDRLVYDSSHLRFLEIYDSVTSMRSRARS
jgi:glycosyltransferase involved in cell wall biosynthesis